MTVRPISEDDLQAFVDNALEPERRRDVSEYLLTNPEAAARVAAYQRQAAALRAALDPVARQPVPSRLNLDTIAAASPQTPSFSRFRMAAAAVVLLTVGAVGGWTVKGYGLPPTEGVAALAMEAAASYTAFATDSLRPVEVKADASDTLKQFAKSTLGSAASIPDLTKAGYHVVGGRVVPTVHGVGFMLMYDNGKGSQLVLLSRQMAVDQNKAMVESDGGKVRGWSWAKDGLGFSLVGTLPAQELHPIADAVRSQV